MRMIVIFVALLFVSNHGQASDLDAWITKETPIALKGLIQNISPSGTAPGAVIASPDRPYYFHWVRDAAITMRALSLVSGLNPQAQKARDQLMWAYAGFSRKNQLTPNPSGPIRGLGEPKFNVDGTAFLGDWGRPQDDGPALRAITVISFAQKLLAQGLPDQAKILYDGQLPSQSLIKSDLEYIAHHWREASFDPWEEVLGHHFFTGLVTRHALKMGAVLAHQMGDPFAAQFYDQEAKTLEGILPFHYNGRYLIETFGRQSGIDYKTSNLDSAAILAVLLCDGETFMGINDPRVVDTVRAIEQGFQNLYPVNRTAFTKRPLAPAIGRYPEDRYMGGNPWILATLGMAEYYYRAGHFTQGESYMERVMFHTGADGSLWEQWDKNTGFMTSMRDLTWSYAAFLTAVEARRAAQLKQAVKR